MDVGYKSEGQIPIEEFKDLEGKVSVKEGDKVLFAKYSGNDIKIDGVEHLILREDDVLAILD